MLRDPELKTEENSHRAPLTADAVSCACWSNGWTAAAAGLWKSDSILTCSTFRAATKKISEQ
jgi:hypothetical protein